MIVAGYQEGLGHQIQTFLSSTTSLLRGVLTCGYIIILVQINKTSNKNSIQSEKNNSMFTLFSIQLPIPTKLPYLKIIIEKIYVSWLVEKGVPRLESSNNNHIIVHHYTGLDPF